MNRNFFGLWGAELTSDEFAKALAEFGANAGPARLDEKLEEAVVTNQPLHLHRLYPGGFPAPEVSVASNLARIWTEATERYRHLGGDKGLRLSIPDSIGSQWFATQLSRPSVGAISVYVRHEGESVEIGWKWPFRIGFLNDAGSEILRSRVQEEWSRHPWLANITRFVRPSVGEDCDLLVLPHSLEDSLPLLLRTQGLQADCVVILGGSRFNDEPRRALLAALMATVKTSGVVLVPAASRYPASWLVDVIRTLSHDSTMDVAFAAATREMVSRHPEHFSESSPAEYMPFFLASERLAQFHLLKRVEAMVKEMRTSARPQVDVKPHVTREGRPTRRGTVRGISPPPPRMESSATRSFDVMREHLERGIKDIGFARESDMATIAADAQEALSQSTPPPDAPDAARYIQASVNPGEEGAETDQARSFKTGSVNTIHVRVGLPEQGWITPADRQRFPDEELPPGVASHVLGVVITSPGLLEEPLLGEITLPREGSSSVAAFFVFVPEDTASVDLRIIILHRNRVLQTARLRGSFGETNSIQFEIESVVRHTLRGLDSRTTFDASLLLNHGTTGPGITLATDRRARFRPAPDLDKLIKFFDQKLTQVAKDWKNYQGPLDSEEQTDLLRELARYGSLLYRQVVVDGIGSGPLSQGERIQVLSLVTEARLPVELLYDRETPEPDAPLCPRAAEGLRAGTCLCNQPDDGTVVCPFGFWGVSKVLERHAFIKQDLQENADFAFTGKDPVERQNTLDALRSGVCGWSQRVSKTVPASELDAIRSKLQQAAPGSVPVATWPDLVKAVDDTAPSLILLIVHTEDNDSGIGQKAELGEESWLDVIDLKLRHIQPKDEQKRKQRPIVFLIGCETGSPTISFISFADQLRHAGASIILTSTAKIHSTQAVQLANAILDQLKEKGSGETTTVGEVMRTVRRKMLADGKVMVLCLSVFGDADWRLI